ncbi:MAG: M20/M25/M40 family metallo-hydrolase [Longimicrobiales bacterium]|nr:M20/M25/M40 family metallo-hydrolase [Longimicrobiales bacterium]
MRTHTLRTLALTAALACASVTSSLSAQTADPQATRQVRSLAANAAMQEAFRRIEALDPWGMERLLELTQIPAPPFGEAARAARYAELLREAGADSVWTDPEGNVVALRKGRRGRRTVVLGGHMDTVFPEGTDVTVRQVGDTLFAPGIGDDTRGLVVVLTTLRAMEEAGVETDDDVLFVGTVGEEGLGDLRGMKQLFREGAEPIHAWIEVDGGGLGGIVSMGLGSYRFRVTFEGAGGHSWGAFGLANPAHALGRGIRHFQDAADTLTRSGPRTSYNVGVIGGGTSINSIPFEAWAEVDMRSEGGASSLDRMEAALRAAMRRAAEEENALRRRGDPLTVEVAKIGNRPSGEMDPQQPLVQRAIAANEFFGADGDLGRSSTNSNIPISLGVPAVTIGRGGVGGENHSPGEWWINRDGHLAIQRALLLLVAEAGLAALVP